MPTIPHSGKNKHSLLIMTVASMAMIVAATLFAPDASAATPEAPTQTEMKSAALMRAEARRARNGTGTIVRRAPLKTTSGSLALNMRSRAADRAASRLARLHKAADEEHIIQSARLRRMTVEMFRDEVFRIVNEQRAIVGLDPYRHNAILEESAQDYAELMQKETFFAHVTPDGGTLKDRMHASGYYKGGNYSYYYGENLARGQDSPEEVVEDWMNSPPHREAIMSESFLEIGIGKAGEYWVQHFGAIK
jgi:uncharacterized protein YkwD